MRHSIPKYHVIMWPKKTSVKFWKIFLEGYPNVWRKLISLYLFYLHFLSLWYFAFLFFFYFVIYIEWIPLAPMVVKITSFYELIALKWSFTNKQHAWEPPQNQTWKIDLWPLQTEILKIKVGFTKKMPEKVEKITRTPAELRPSDFSLRFLGWNSYISAEFQQVYF